MHKFKVGDIVIGKKGAPYGVTREGTIWKVHKTGSEYLILCHPSNSKEIYEVEARHFDIYDKSKLPPTPSYKPLYPEVFVYKNGRSQDGFTVVDAITGNHMEDLDDILLFNVTFKKLFDKRGFLGIPSYNYNKYVESIINPEGYKELYYKLGKFIKPHYVDMKSQPTKVHYLYIKNNKILAKGNEFADDYSLRLYINTKIHTTPGRPLPEDEEGDVPDDVASRPTVTWRTITNVTG